MDNTPDIEKLEPTQQGVSEGKARQRKKAAPKKKRPTPSKEQNTSAVGLPLQAKIAGLGVLLILVVAAVVVFYASTTLRSRGIQAATEEIQIEGSRIALEVQDALEPAIDVARVLSQSLTAIQDPESPISLSREQVNAMLRETLEANPQFLGVYTLWEPNAFDGLDAQYANTVAHDETGRFIPYWFRDLQGNITLDALVEYETPGIGDWYLIPRATQEEQVISPFIYPIEGVDVLLTSWVSPIVVNNQFYGIVGVDLRTDFLQEIADTFSFMGGTGELAIIASDGNVAGATGQANLVGQPAAQLFSDGSEAVQALQADQTVVQQRPEQNELRVFEPMYLGDSSEPWFVSVTVPFSKATEGIWPVIAQLLVIIGVLTIIAIIAFYALARSITKPVAELVNISSRVGRGDLSSLAKVNSNDEIGVLARTFNDTIARLRGSIQTEAERDEERRQREELQQNIGAFLDVAMDIAEGDFTKRGNVSEDVLGNIVDAINLMVEEVAYLLGQTRDAALSVNEGASEMIATTESIAQSAQRQAAEAERARTETEQVTASIRKMAEQADESANASTQALEASRQGEAAVQNTLKGMQGIRNEVQSITERTKSLTQRSEEISGIVRSISRIASQTNLLALSASLEAAGAGEAGKRFATVASEVQDLAEDSANAARQVASIIRELQGEINEVAALTESGSKEVEEGYQVATEAGQRLREIADISTKSAELARFISQASQEQVQGVEGVNEIVQTMTEISQASQGSVTQGRDAAERLQQLSAQLTEGLSRFRLTS